MVLFISILSAKYSSAQTTFSIKTGINLSTLAVKEADFEVDNSSIIGIPIGISADIKFYKSLYLQPSVYLSNKGYKSSNFRFGNDFKAKVSYLELPVNFIYKHDIKSNNLIVGLGAYMGLGLNGKWSTANDVLIDDINIGKKGDIKFQNDALYNNYGNYIYGKSWDYGITALIGYELRKKYLIQVNTSNGLRNLTPNWGYFIPDTKQFNRTMGLTIGYIF